MAIDSKRTVRDSGGVYGAKGRDDEVESLVRWASCSYKNCRVEPRDFKFVASEADHASLVVR